MKIDEFMTTEEIAKLIRPLFDQIRYYQVKYHHAEIELREIANLPWYRRIFLRKKIQKYLRNSLVNNRESETLIENLANFAENDPDLFRFYKEFYSPKSTMNN